MANKFQALINFLKEQKSFGRLENATVEVHIGHDHLYLGIDSSEVVYQIKYETNDEILALAFELVALTIKEKKVDQIFLFSKEDINVKFADEQECITFINHSGVKLDMALSFVRKALFDYWGFLAVTDEIDDLICRCKGIGKKQIIEKYYSSGSDAKKVFIETNISGVCGSCKSDVNKILNALELSEEELFGQNKEFWQNKIDELINEYYLVCPPDFSELKFDFISITPRVIKLKCHRKSKVPSRPAIQDSLNNFFKGQFDREIPISIVI